MADKLSCPVCGWTPSLQAPSVLDLHVKVAHVDENDIDGINKAVDAGKLWERADGTFTITAAGAK
jgi:hypothetical protein